VIAQTKDPRVRYRNLPYRGPYPEEQSKLWLVGGTPPYNAAVRLARGRWIAYLSDDDAFRPEHLSQLLAKAREERLELCYGLLVQHRPDGSQQQLGAFPPRQGEFGFQAAVYHAGLAEFLEFELADSAFGAPVDWSLCRRMLRIGVRMGMLAEPTTDYFPSWDWGGRKEQHGY
jgi:Glycosyl transferase family 2